MSALGATTLALGDNWLDTSPNMVQAFDNIGWYYGGCWYPYYYPYTVTRTECTMIRLTLSEVERLRKAAKADDKLREVLQKFTPHIEVEVDI